MSIKLLSITTSFAALSILIPSLTYARPPVELVPESAISNRIRAWNHGADTPWGTATSYAPPQPIYATGKEPFSDNRADDLMLWEAIGANGTTIQTIKAGDIVIADFPVQKAMGAIRQVKSVTATTMTSMNGSTIPLTNVKGIVRKIVRKFIPVAP